VGGGRGESQPSHLFPPLYPQKAKEPSTGASKSHPPHQVPKPLPTSKIRGPPVFCVFRTRPPPTTPLAREKSSIDFVVLLFCFFFFFNFPNMNKSTCQAPPLKKEKAGPTNRGRGWEKFFRPPCKIQSKKFGPKNGTPIPPVPPPPPKHKPQEIKCWEKGLPPARGLPFSK